MRTCLLVFWCVLSSCAQVEHKPTYTNASVLIRVEHLAPQDAWRVRYSVSNPVTALYFERNINRFRHSRWRPLNPDIQIQESGGHEKILSLTGRSFTEAEFELDSYYEITPKDYEFFLQFSDQSVVMYTGHFNVCPENDDCSLPNEFKFKVREDENGVLAGKVFTGTATWVDDSFKGTYVYFGKLNIIRTSAITAIVDPALPPWLLWNIKTMLPKLFAFYSDETKQRLNFKPFVFVNYVDKANEMSKHGGTLPGIIQLSIEGKEWQKKNAEGLIGISRFLAHEAAHLWNARMFPYAQNDMWMHEGGADAFAFLALLKLKIISKSQFSELQYEAFDLCLKKTNGRPLLEVKDDPEYRAFYKCGSIFGLMSDAAVRKKKNRQSLFILWAKIFEGVKLTGKPYTEKNYFDALDTLAGQTHTHEAIQALLTQKMTSDAGPEVLYQDEFKRLGLKIKKAR